MASRESGEIEIMGLGYRIAHLVNLILFISLMVSGFMLYSIETVSWFAYGIGQPLSTLSSGTDPVTTGVQWARTWHRVVGFTWGAFILAYALYILLFHRQLHVFDGLRKPLGDQIREAKAVVRHYILGEPIPEDVRERMGRHNVLVGYLAILILASVLLLSVSGVLLVYAEAWGLSLSTVRLLLLLHDVGFALALLFVLLHTFAVLLPHNRPLLVAMFSHGKVPLDWAREHMPGYLRRLAGR